MSSHSQMNFSLLFFSHSNVFAVKLTHKKKHTHTHTAHVRAHSFTPIHSRIYVFFLNQFIECIRSATQWHYLDFECPCPNDNTQQHSLNMIEGATVAVCQHRRNRINRNSGDKIFYFWVTTRIKTKQKNETETTIQHHNIIARLPFFFIFFFISLFLLLYFATTHLGMTNLIRINKLNALLFDVVVVIIVVFIVVVVVVEHLACDELFNHSILTWYH